jgi:sugar fermentation stimulation protein A
MKYDNIYEGIFIKRLNRFVAIVEIDGNEETVHVKNTGRCGELLIKGAKIYLQYVDKESRKTKYSLISILKGDNLFNIDSQVPNKVIEDALRNNKIKGLKDLDFLKREQTYGNSRFDFYFEKDNRKGYIEVKGVTLENNGEAKFPDAPTSRGTKHVNELVEAKKDGYESYIFFLLQFKGANSFSTNREMDPTFAKAVDEAVENDVKVLVYDSVVKKDSIIISEEINYVRD